MLDCSYYREREITVKTQVLIFDRYYLKSNNINYSLERLFKRFMFKLAATPLEASSGTLNGFLLFKILLCCV